MKAAIEKLVSLLRGEASQELQDYLSTLADDKLTAMITQSALKGKSIGPVIKAIFKGSPISSQVGMERRLLVYKHCIPLCESGDISAEVVSDIIGLLMLEVPHLSGPSLAHLASLIVDAIKVGSMNSGKSLELFPTILTTLSAAETVAYSKGELSGNEYKKQLINSLCSNRWDPQCVIHLTSMFRDVPLATEELQFVVEKVLRMFPKLDLQEVPPLVYQLLLLSTKGCKKLVLEGIVRYFNEQDQHQKEEQRDSQSRDVQVQSIPQDQLRHVQGTTILHTVFAVRLDHELGRELLKNIKQSGVGELGELCPFNVALLLSVARIQRYEEQAFALLKAAILKNFKDKQVQEGSGFVRELVAPCPGVAQAVLDTVRNSVFGWDHVTQGLLQLGFILMDSFGPKAGPFGKAAEATVSAGQSPAQQACRLGSRLLLEGFKMHEPIRSEILEQVLNRLVTKTAAPVTHFIELFADIVVSAPMILLESSSKVMETFDNLSYLPLSTVQGLLKAVQPLLRVSMNMKDALILVLRKAMFSSQLEARKSAVAGFLLLLKNFKVLGSLSCSQASQNVSSSQIQVDVHSRYNSAANEAFCLEILGSLRRCLSQQADVRLMLYEGFHDVLRRNSQLASSIMQTLLSQLQRYYEPEPDLLPPVKMENCITAQGDGVFLLEPLAHLLSCTVHCLLWHQELQNQSRADDDDDEEEEEGGLHEDLQAILDSMTRRMIKSELEDFELDKSADFALSSSVGVKNSIYGLLVSGVYEVLMEYTFHCANYSRSRLEELLELFNRYHRLSEMLKEKCSKGKASSSKPGRSLLSLGCVGTLLKALFRDSTLSREDGLSVLRSSPEFLSYVVGVALQKVQHLEETGQTDGPDGQNADKAFQHLCDITSVLLWRYLHISPATEEGGKKEKGRSISLLCLEGVLKSFRTALQRHPTRLGHFLSAVGAANEEDQQAEENINITEKMDFYIRQFQRALATLLSGEEDDFNSKEAQVLLSLLSVLSRQLQPSSSQFEQMLTWTVKICKESSFEDAPFCRGLLSLLFSLHWVCKSPVTVLWELSQDIHSQLGDVDQDVEVEKQSHFAVVNMKTAAPTALLVLTQVEKVLDEVDWLIARKRLDCGRDTESSEAALSGRQQDPVEKAVTLQLGTLLTALNELVQTALPPGSYTDTLLKELMRTYSLLTTFTKYYIQLCSSQGRPLPSRFEKLVKLSGSHLTPQCYSLITYIQSGEVESSAREKKTAKRDEAVATASAKVLRETKAIPNLIFSIEQYEKFLILLSKKSKVNLMQYMKLSTSRDFRINAAVLETALQESEEATVSQDAEASGEPQKKRRK
ncbi:Fanconi anemia group I protein isoform X6 [Paramormyrops kingsleyae]|uniref:Fanconi anemia group I protein isoform X6 n=1 Tax=Paramormyrops kingsleyae TaxID=1676925 RepID=UPI000CD61D33|nr:Fanconi anemia group I protein isoform X3 [Paramormyrops kingsleyae]